MDVRSAILKEHSKQQCERIVKYVGSNADRFAEVMKLFFEGDYRITQRIAWPMAYIVEEHPSLIKPYLKKLLENVHNSKLHVSVKRNTIRLLQFIDIPEKFQGKVMSLCFDLIQSHEETVAVKAFSLTVLQNLAKKYPEIIPEVKLLIEESWAHESVAFHTRAKKFLRVTSTMKWES